MFLKDAQIKIIKNQHKLELNNSKVRNLSQNDKKMF